MTMENIEEPLVCWGGEDRMNNLWDVEEDGNGDDRKEVSEETSTVWSGVHQDL